MLNYWMIVERKENWQQDFYEGFSQFGFPERKLKLASNISEGDILITYVSSGQSSIADVRRVTASGLKKLRFGGDYDTAYPAAIKTEPVWVLQQENWIKFDTIADKLEFSQSKKDWRQIFRNSLFRLTDADGATLVNAIKRKEIAKRD